MSVSIKSCYKSCQGESRGYLHLAEMGIPRCVVAIETCVAPLSPPPIPHLALALSHLAPPCVAPFGLTGPLVCSPTPPLPSDRLNFPPPGLRCLFGCSFQSHLKWFNLPSCATLHAKIIYLFFSEINSPLICFSTNFGAKLKKKFGCSIKSNVFTVSS